MKRMLLVSLLVFGFMLSWNTVNAGDFYVIAVKKCCTCKGTLYEKRWCDNGNGTVTDLTTCLVWLKKADWGGQKQWRNDSDCSAPDYTCYDDAQTRAGFLCDGADGANLSDGSVEGDWRLPTKTELVGLVNGTPNLHCYPGPCDLYGFNGVQPSAYWSSSTYTYDGSTFGAWGVYMDGFVSIYGKDNSNYVWPVRGGN